MASTTLLLALLAATPPTLQALSTRSRIADANYRCALQDSSNLKDALQKIEGSRFLKLKTEGEAAIAKREAMKVAYEASATAAGLTPPSLSSTSSSTSSSSTTTAAAAAASVVKLSPEGVARRAALAAEWIQNEGFYSPVKEEMMAEDFVFMGPGE
jgi:hypothetical protein